MAPPARPCRGTARSLYTGRASAASGRTPSHASQPILIPPAANRLDEREYALARTLPSRCPANATNPSCPRRTGGLFWTKFARMGPDKVNFSSLDSTGLERTGHLQAEFRRAQQFYANGQLDDAEHVCRFVLKVDNRRFEAANLLGLILWQRRDVKAAERNFR